MLLYTCISFNMSTIHTKAVSDTEEEEDEGEQATRRLEPPRLAVLRLRWLPRRFMGRRKRLQLRRRRMKLKLRRRWPVLLLRRRTVLLQVGVMLPRGAIRRVRHLRRRIGRPVVVRALLLLLLVWRRVVVVHGRAVVVVAHGLLRRRVRERRHMRRRRGVCGRFVVPVPIVGRHGEGRRVAASGRVLRMRAAVGMRRRACIPHRRRRQHTTLVHRLGLPRRALMPVRLELQRRRNVLYRVVDAQDALACRLAARAVVRRAVAAIMPAVARRAVPAVRAVRRRARRRR